MAVSLPRRILMAGGVEDDLSSWPPPGSQAWPILSVGLFLISMIFTIVTCTFTRKNQQPKSDIGRVQLPAKTDSNGRKAAVKGTAAPEATREAKYEMRLPKQPQEEEEEEQVAGELVMERGMGTCCEEAGRPLGMELRRSSKLEVLNPVLEDEGAAGLRRASTRSEHFVRANDNDSLLPAASSSELRLSQMIRDQLGSRLLPQALSLPRRATIIKNTNPENDSFQLEHNLLLQCTTHAFSESEQRARAFLTLVTQRHSFNGLSVEGLSWDAAANLGAMGTGSLPAGAFTAGQRRLSQHWKTDAIAEAVGSSAATPHAAANPAQPAAAIPSPRASSRKPRNGVGEPSTSSSSGSKTTGHAHGSGDAPHRRSDAPRRSRRSSPAAPTGQPLASAPPPRVLRTDSPGSPSQRRQGGGGPARAVSSPLPHELPQLAAVTTDAGVQPPKTISVNTSSSKQGLYGSGKAAAGAGPSAPSSLKLALSPRRGNSTGPVLQLPLDLRPLEAPAVASALRRKLSAPLTKMTKGAVTPPTEVGLRPLGRKLSDPAAMATALAVIEAGPQPKPGGGAVGDQGQGSSMYFSAQDNPATDGGHHANLPPTLAPARTGPRHARAPSPPAKASPHVSLAVPPPRGAAAAASDGSHVVEPGTQPQQRSMSSSSSTRAGAAAAAAICRPSPWESGTTGAASGLPCSTDDFIEGVKNPTQRSLLMAASLWALEVQGRSALSGSSGFEPDSSGSGYHPADGSGAAAAHASGMGDSTLSTTASQSSLLRDYHQFQPGLTLFMDKGRDDSGRGAAPSLLDGDDMGRVLAPAKAVQEERRNVHEHTQTVLTALEGLLQPDVDARLRERQGLASVVSLLMPRRDDVDLQVDLKRDLSFKKLLGQGSFGTVYQAVWTRKSGECQEVAVKVCDFLEGQPGVSEKAMDRMEDELEISTRLNHPHVVCCFGGCVNSQYGCVLLENMEGGTLAQYILDKGRRGCSYREVLLMGLQLSDALRYLHPLVVHCDIKPDNILLTPDGLLKMSDFGQSRMKTGSSLLGPVEGTRRYRAPETLTGRGVSERADIYSLGMVLWQAVTGEVPWQEIEDSQIVHYVVEEAMRPPMPASLPVAMQALIRNCWDPHPAIRPSAYDIYRRCQVLLAAASDDPLHHDAALHS